MWGEPGRGGGLLVIFGAAKRCSRQRRDAAGQRHSGSSGGEWIISDSEAVCALLASQAGLKSV